MRRRLLLKQRARRLVSWGLALAALAFVVHAVPIRDRCAEPAAQGATGAQDGAPEGAPRDDRAAAGASGARPAVDDARRGGDRRPAGRGGAPERVPVTRRPNGCILHRPSGDAWLDAAACARLDCEPGLASTLARARVGWLAALLVVYFASTAVWAARWRALLALAGIHASLVSTWRIALEAQAGGVLLPGGFGGDALRVAFVVGLVGARRGAAAAASDAPPARDAATDATAAASPNAATSNGWKARAVSTAIASVALDRALGLVTMAAIAAAAALLLGGGGGAGGEIGPAALVLAAVPFAFVLGIAAVRLAWSRGLARAPLLERGLFASTLRPILAYLGDPRAPRAISAGLLVSLVVSALQLGVIRGIVFALGGAPSPERWVYIGTTMSFVVAAIPALPGGWGTSDAAFVFFLGKAGLAPSIALAVSLLYRLFWYSSGGVGAISFLLRSSRGERDRAVDPRP